MIYCISDIHGEYDRFITMLGLIGLRPEDTLYILGDVIDRGPHPIKTLLKIMDMPNAKFILGNHELMMLETLKDGTDSVITADMSDLDGDTLERLMLWYHNGCKTTVEELHQLDREGQLSVTEYLKNALAYELVGVNGQQFLLVHAGLMNFDPAAPLSEYALYELVWARPDYSKPYFEDIITVTGHTPTMHIPGCPAPGRIFKQNNHVVIDCGASIGGSLACLRLDDMKEYYV